MRQKTEQSSELAGRGESAEAGSDVEILAVNSDNENPAWNNCLMEEILSRANLQQALQRVKSNKGAPGVDGMTVAELPEYLKANWVTIKEQLLNNTYKPHPVKRVEISKPDGGVRKLGIPTVLDRFIQQAAMQVLQAKWDGTFSPHSYGFRPNKSAHQAVCQAQDYIRKGDNWVVDIDLEQFFDRVNHDRLMAKIAERVSDKRVLKLVRAFLTSGVMENGLVSSTAEGTPQGGPLSPLLSNLVLDELDQELTKRGHRFVRYADDANIYVKSRRAGQRVMSSVSKFITTRLKLKVNRSKSAVDRPQNRTFLGFTFSKSNRRKLAPKAIKRFKDRVRYITSRTGGRSLKQVAAQLKSYLKGWHQYFGIAQLKKDFDLLNSWIRHKLRCMLWKQWGTRKRRYQELKRRGVRPYTAWVTMKSGHGPWRLSRSPGVMQALSSAFFAALGIPELTTTSVLSSRRTAV